jgi:hypothetical protein
MIKNLKIFLFLSISIFSKNTLSSFEFFENKIAKRVVLINENKDYFRFFLNIDNINLENALDEKRYISYVFGIKTFIIQNSFKYNIYNIKGNTKQDEKFLKFLGFKKSKKNTELFEINKLPKSRL